MVVLIDSREQQQLEFDNELITGVEVVKLNVGDYAVRFNDGHVPAIRFERKSISDLFGTLGKGYKRFKREIGRAHDDDVLLVIIIEGTMSKVEKGFAYSERTGGAVVKQLFTLMVRHHVPFVCTSSRQEMADYITRFFIAVGEDYMLKKKESYKTK